MPKLIATDVEELYGDATLKKALMLTSRRYDDGTKRITIEEGLPGYSPTIRTRRFDTLTDARAWLSIEGYRLWPKP